jgi:hypothetical protein
MQKEYNLCFISDISFDKSIKDNITTDGTGDNAKLKLTDNNQPGNWISQPYDSTYYDIEWLYIKFDLSENGSDNIKIYGKAANSISDLDSADFKELQNNDRSGLVGRFIQLKVEIIPSESYINCIKINFATPPAEEIRP